MQEPANRARPLRIAAVAYTHFASDPRVRREAKTLTSAGCDVDVFSLSDSGVPRDDPDSGACLRGISLKRYRGASSSSYIRSYGAFLIKAKIKMVLQHIRRSYDLVHIHTMPDLMILSAMPIKVTGVPILLDIHDPMPEIFAEKFGVGWSDWRIRLLFLSERFAGGFADAVVTATRTLATRLVENGIAADKVRVIHNLPDGDIFGAPGSALGREDPSVFRLIHHGTLVHRLGIGLALESIASIRNEMDGMGPWRFEILGDGDGRDDFLRMTRDLGLEDRVSFSDGMVPVEELPGMLKGAALALVPSTVQRDTEFMLPTKLLEYVYLGIPAITSGTRTVLQYFNPDQVCCVSSGEPRAWGAKILEMRQDIDRRRQQAGRALAFFKEHQWKNEAASLLRIVSNLTGRNLSGPRMEDEERSESADHRAGAPSSTVEAPGRVARNGGTAH